MRTFTLPLTRVIIGSCVVSLACAQPPSKPAKRPFTIDDIYRGEMVKGTASPDGKLVAFAKNLSLEEEGDRFPNSRRARTNTFVTFDRDDIAVLNLDDGKRVDVFRAGEGGMDGAQYFWSPDGRFLALMERQGDRYRIEIWNRASSTKYAATPLYVFESASASFAARSWISKTQFAVWVPPQPANFDARIGFFQQPAVQGWIERERGVTPSVSVVDTARSPNPGRDLGTVYLVDAERHTSEVLLKGEVSTIAVAPDGKLSALITVDPPTPPDPSKPFPPMNRSVEGSQPRGATHLKIAEAGRTQTVDAPGADKLIKNGISWSPDGTRFTYLSVSTFGTDLPELYVYSAAVRKSTRTQFTDVMHPRTLLRDFIWIGGHQLLYFAGPAGKPKQWHLISEDGTLRAIPGKAIPPQIYAENTAKGDRPPVFKSSFLYVEGGKLWRFDLAKESAECLTRESSVTLASVTWASAEAAVVSQAAVGSGSKQSEPARFFLFRAPAEELRPLQLPKGPGYFFDAYYDPKTGAAVVSGVAGSAVSIWSANMFDGSQKLIARADNSYQDEIDRSEIRVIEYTGIDGQPLNASLLLPYGYQRGKRYPTVVSVYPGLVQTGPNPRLNSLNTYPGSGLWFSAHGYAVLEPSMPATQGQGDNFLDLTKGVMPAIDKAVEMGIVDPNRLAVAGHSYGGYAVYGLITQTTRFKAAIAYAGVADLFSIYGQFRAQDRYTDFPVESDLLRQWTESGQAALGATPWDDPQRYLRNSPLFYVTRIQTPILILQGDMDYSPMQQGEEFFSAMLRLNKTARFVRYWGEWHSVAGPANARHLHQQMTDWLDTYLAPGSPPKSAAIEPR